MHLVGSLPAAAVHGQSMPSSQHARPALQDMHAYWRWYTWLDPLHYAWTALVLNQYDGTGILYNGVTVRILSKCKCVCPVVCIGRACRPHGTMHVHIMSKVGAFGRLCANEPAQSTHVMWSQPVRS